VTNRKWLWRCKSVASGCLALVVLLLRVVPADGQHNATAEQEFQAAMNAQDHGDLHKAESILLALRTKHPGIFAVDESLGLLYGIQEKFELAVPILKVAVKENPASAIAHANLGAAYLKQDKSTDAVHELQAAERLNPQDRDTESNLGQALLAAGQRVEAAKAYGRAVALDPGNSDLRCDWAALLLDNGDIDQAAKVLAALDRADTIPRAQALLGEIAERQGRFLNAVEHLQTAAKLDPSEANLYLLGMEYLKHWTFQPASQFFEYGIKRYPSSERMRLAMGITYYSMNQLAQAAPIFAQLLETHPENASYAELLGRSCTLTPDAIKECEDLQRYAEAHPGNADVDIYAAETILARSNQAPNVETAVKLLDAAIRADPKSAEAHLQKGLVLQGGEKWQQSISELETSIAYRPASSKAHYRLALAYSHVGNREKAQEQITLQKMYREEERNGVDARLSEVQMFLVNTP